MPGIFGVIDFTPDRSESRQREIVAIARRMAAAMHYESWYADLLVSCPTLGACVGRVGFADDRGSVGGAETNVVVVATGETSPSELQMARAYQRSGEDGILSLGGICAGFVADESRATCFLFNDPFGRERIFLHSSGPRVFFSSEAKAILAVAPETRALDPTGLAEWLTCGCTLGTHSLFRGIEVLEGGMVLTITGGAVKRRRYFQPARLEQLEPVSGEEFLEGFPVALRSAVNEFVGTTPKLGISLTGGLDSRMVMASLDAQPGSVPCYTFGSMYRTTGDVAVARQVATGCGQPHRVLELGTEFVRNVPENLEQSVYVSDGYLGLSGAAELYVNRLARSIAPARMTGNWGGELMRGVRAFKHVMPKGGFVNPELSKEMSESAAAFSTTSSNSLSAALFDQMPCQGYGRYAIERSQVVMRSPFLADDVISWLYRAPAATRASSAGAAAVIGRRPGLLAIPTDLGMLGAQPSIVRRSWRRALVKAEYLTSHGAPDWLARLSAWLPGTLMETRFLGVDKFQHFRYWMRCNLDGFIRETLLQDNSNGLGTWFDMPRVAQMVNDHIDGHANYTGEIDRLLTLAVVQKRLLTGYTKAQ